MPFVPVKNKTLGKFVPVDVESVAGAAEDFSSFNQTEQTSLPPLPREQGDPRNRDEFGNLTDQGFIIEYRRQNEAGEPIELDIQTGADFLTRAKLGLTSDPEARQDILQSTFQGATIEQVEDGIIVRGLRDPETGAEKDLLVDERSPNFVKDLADLSGVALETAGAAILTSLTSGSVTGGAAVLKGITKSKAALQALRQGAAGVAGAVGAGAAGEAAVGGDPMGRVEEGKTDLLIEAGLQSLPLGLAIAVDTFGSGARGQIQRDLIDSVGRLKASTGIEIPLTIGEGTGRRAFQTAESLNSAVPGGSGKISQAKEASEDAIRSVQRFAFGAGELPSSVAASTRATRALSRQLNIEDVTLLNKRIDDITESSHAVRGMIDAATPRASGTVFTREAGLGTRRAFQAVHKAFQNESDKLYGMIRGQDVKFSSKNVKARAAAIKKELAKKEIPEETVETVSPIVDEFGKPFVSEETTPATQEVSRKLAPSGLMRLLDGVAELPDDVPLNELRALRTQINDSVSDSEILKTVPSRRLRQVSQSITEAIDEGTANLPSGKLKADLDRANAFYRSNIPRFQEKGLENLLADPTQVKVEDAAFVRSLLQSPDQYNRVKRAITKDLTGLEGSPAIQSGQVAFDTLKRSMLAELTDNSVASGGLIDVKKFADNISKLDREISTDLLGSDARNALTQVRNSLSVSDRIAPDRLADVLRDPKVSANQLTQLVKETKRSNELYRNSIIKRLVRGSSDPSDVIKSDEFVEKFLEGSTAQEVKQVMDVLRKHSDLTEDIRRLTVMNLFQRSAAKPGQKALVAQMKGDPTRTFDADKLGSILSSPKEKAKLNEVIDPDTMAILQDLVTVQKSKSEVERAGKAAGGLIAGSIISNIMQVRQWPSILNFHVAATLMTNPRLRALATRTTPMDTSKLARLMAVSGPVTRAIFSDYPRDVAEVLQLAMLSRMPPTSEEIVGGIAEAAERESLEEPAPPVNP